MSKLYHQSLSSFLFSLFALPSFSVFILEHIPLNFYILYIPPPLEPFPPCPTLQSLWKTIIMPLTQPSKSKRFDLMKLLA